MFTRKLYLLQDDFDPFTMESSQHNIATEEIVNMADLEKVGLPTCSIQRFQSGL
jgi:hypothetical protein